MSTFTSTVTSFVRTLKENILALAQRAERLHTQTDRRLTVFVNHGTGFGRTSYEYGLYTSDSPAQVACNLVKENPHLAERNATVWFHDPNFANAHPFRFRCIMHDGQPHVRMIDPRRR